MLDTVCLTGCYPFISSAVTFSSFCCLWVFVFCLCSSHILFVFQEHSWIPRMNVLEDFPGNPTEEEKKNMFLLYFFHLDLTPITFSFFFFQSFKMKSKCNLQLIFANTLE